MRPSQVSATGTHLWQWHRMPVLIDIGLAALVAAATIIAISVATEPSSRPPDAVAYVLGGMIGVVLLARRRWPLAVLLASAALLFLYYSLNYPGIPPAIPLAVALYTAVTAGYLRWGAPISAFFIVTGIIVVVIRKHESFPLVLTKMVDQAALLAVVVLLGEAVRNRRQYTAEVRERLQQAEADKAREAARQVAEERLRIARELHDVMAHTITAITVQAGLAADVLDDSPAQARTALNAIRAASREAMTEVKATVSVLRAGDGTAVPRSPIPTLDQLDGLLAETRGGGLHVELATRGIPRPLSAPVDNTAYRIVQESLTNVIRHSGTRCATVEISYEPAALGIKITNNGIDAGANPGTRYNSGPLASMQQSGQGGHGLIGMTERATALGGWLKAGPQPNGDFLVQAWLPTEGASSV